jgi:hypothetical protein
VSGNHATGIETIEFIYPSDMSKLGCSGKESILVSLCLLRLSFTDPKSFHARRVEYEAAKAQALRPQRLAELAILLRDLDGLEAVDWVRDGLKVPIDKDSRFYRFMCLSEHSNTTVGSSLKVIFCQ